MKFNILKMLGISKRKVSGGENYTSAQMPVSFQTQRFTTLQSRTGDTSTTNAVIYYETRPMGNEPNESDMPREIAKESDDKIAAKPKDVVNELFCRTEDFQIDLTNLKAKIKAVRKRRDFMKDDLQLGVADEEQALFWLENRLRYVKLKKVFNWQITLQSNIDALCKKYKVRVAGMSSYKRCVPAEAIEEMEKFIKLYRKVTKSKEKPSIDLIVDVGGPEEKKDPIVLAKSPLGNYFYVLGAWDKEVAVMDELFLRK
jgi:hypothetical protein